MTGIQWGAVVGAAGLLITLITALIRLASSMSKLNTTMDIFAKKFDKTDETLCKHGDQLADHETRITVIESKPPRKRTA